MLGPAMLSWMERDGELERQVLAWVQAGDAHAAAERVVRELGPDLLGYLNAVLSSEEDAREVFAELSADLLSALARFRGEGSLKSFTYRMAWRLAMRMRRSPARRRMRALGSHEASALPIEGRVSTAAYRRTGPQDWLSQMRASLSPFEQSLLTLRVDRELAWDEVARVMGLPGGTDETARLRKRFERIKEKLRSAAERDGILG